ncbi:MULTISPECIES: hypothetical protein [unclassified Agromyces]|uniref:hypothetical protein n=1 Tax=unclassified Agromyces TaxID=2639701 RepID=UPI0030143B66
MSELRHAPDRSARRAPVLGLPVLVVLGLVAIALPRVVVHDLGLVPPQGVAAALLAIVPPLVWIGVAVVWSTRPFRSLLAAGAGYGIGLAAIHNLMWGVVFAGDAPRLGGNLAEVPQGIAEVGMRIAASFSSLLVGLAVGALAGLVAWAVRAVVSRAGVSRLPLAAGSARS